MMTPRELSDFLKRLNAYDGRYIDDEGVFAAWFQAAQVGRWTFNEACEAAAEFYSLPSDPKHRRFLEPGNITYLIRARRAGPRVSEAIGELTVGRRSTPEHRARLRAEIDAQLQEQRDNRRPRPGRKPWHDGPVVRDLDDAAIEAGERTVRALLSGPRQAHAAANRVAPSP